MSRHKQRVSRRALTFGLEGRAGRSPHLHEKPPVLPHLPVHPVLALARGEHLAFSGQRKGEVVAALHLPDLAHIWGLGQRLQEAGRLSAAELAELVRSTAEDSAVARERDSVMRPASHLLKFDF